MLHWHCCFDGSFVYGCWGLRVELFPSSLPLGVRAVGGGCVFTSILYSIASSISVCFMLASLNSGKLSTKLAGTESKFHSPRSVR